MTLEELYRQGRDTLKKAGIDSPAFDSVCLFQKAFGLDRQALILRGNEEAGPESGLFRELIRRRAEREPLQYLLGEWGFMDFSLAVGEGVLAPRQETELLVRAAAARLPEDRSLDLLDLCSGSGAVGLGAASLLPRSRVLCVEWMEPALHYLRKNVSRYGDGRVEILRGDVLSPPRFSGSFDAILSNPPYLNGREMTVLQPEVKREPTAALDGGEDGLRFYRAILQLWLPLLKRDGMLAVEIGNTQGAQVRELFCSAGLAEVQGEQDLSGWDRVVLGWKK